MTGTGKGHLGRERYEQIYSCRTLPEQTQRTMELLHFVKYGCPIDIILFPLYGKDVGSLLPCGD
jgi:hypothetical protein